jgi:hypothetical protein
MYSDLKGLEVYVKEQVGKIERGQNQSLISVTLHDPYTIGKPN